MAGNTQCDPIWHVSSSSGVATSVSELLYPCYFTFYFVCPLAYRKKTYVQTLSNFLYVLPVAVSRSSSGDNAICYVLPVLWMTLCFHIIGHMWWTATL